MRRFEAKDLIALATAPMNPDDHWYVDAEQASQYLVTNAHADETVIYASAPAVLIVGALVPTVNVTPVDGDALQNTSLCTDAAWKIQKSWSAAEGYRVYLEPPFPNDRVSALSGGETLVTRRYFSGVHKGPAPIEVSQKLVHCLDIHYIPERNAYCRLDGNGDIEDVIRIMTLPIDEQLEGREVVTILRKDLDIYMAVADLALVIKFDFTRTVRGSFSGWNDLSRYHRDGEDLFYHGGSAARASFMHGAMVVRSQTTLAEQEEAWCRDFEGGSTPLARTLSSKLMPS